MEEKGSQKIEFNSMGAILERLSRITYRINEARGLKRMPDLLDAIVDYYIEISSDLTTDEAKIWEDVKKAQKLVVSPTRSGKWKLIQLNEIDIKLRRLAKKHGYLTKNMKDSTLALVN